MHMRASITASATWATPHAARVLECLFLPILWSAARYVNMAARDVLGVSIPVERSPVI
jgi:integral membrane sensor domain MASE1